MSSSKISKISKQPLAATKHEPTLIDIDNVSVIFGSETSLDSISLCIHAGEFIGLIGPNGAGKTTLLRTILGLQRPTRGTITHTSDAIGYVPQRGSQHDTQVPLCVHEVVQLGTKHRDQNAITDALEAAHLSSFAHKRFGSLSGGQQQRVLIAKALAARPSLLILDEPMTGIDEQSQTEFDAILHELHTSGITIIIVSHDIDAVLAQTKRVICLNRGLLYDGPPEHFEADKYLPRFYAAKHRLLHHKHGVENA